MMEPYRSSWKHPVSHPVRFIESYAGFPTFLSLLAGAVFAMCFLGMGCQPSESTIKNTEAAGKYAAELADCIATSQTIAQSRICRCDVNLRWDRACTDEITEKR